MILYLLFWFGIFKIQRILCQFAPHMDLQKIDEIMFDNTKYSVLRPTIHITRDHFKDFIQKQDNSDFPGRKLFVDRNGIRHYWTGFKARTPKSLRKAILVTNNIPTHQNKKSTNKSNISIEEKNKKFKIDKKQVKFNKTDKAEVVKKKPRRKKKDNKPADTLDINEMIDKPALREDNGKTKVKTTFFCPFFGVVTMISYLD